MPHLRSFRYLIACFGLVATLSTSLKGETVYTPYYFTTIASTRKEGSANGAAAAARFNHPSGVAIDAHGNRFIADRYNHTIRQISPDGQVSTFAGSPGTPGSADGQGSAARFNEPIGVAVDRVGNIVVADYANRTIRRITPQGVVTTIAGSAGILAHTDGLGSAARFIGPAALVTDQAGNILVADSAIPAPGRVSVTYFTTIRKIAPDGVVSTIVGTYAANDSFGSAINPPSGMTVNELRLAYVGCIALDAYGSLYLVEDEKVTKITPGGLISRIIFTEDPQYAPAFNISGIAVNTGGDVFLSDSYFHIVRKLSPDGTLTTVAGSSGNAGDVDGTVGAARLTSPAALTLDASGNLFVTDTASNLLRKITPDGRVSTVAGRIGGTPLDLQLGIITAITDLSIDGQDNLFFAVANAITKMSPDGTLAAFAGTAGQPGSTDGMGTAARFLGLRGLAAAPNGDVYVVDENTIRKITAQGAVTTLAGAAGAAGGNDGTGSAAHFNYPTGLTVDASGNLYVAEPLNNVIRKVTPAGVVTTLAGLANVSGITDGTGSSARLSSQLRWITCDRTTGNLYVLDGGQLRKITPDGTVTTFYGLGPFTGRLAADAAGNLVVTDTKLVWRVTAAGVATLLGGDASAPLGFADGTGMAAHFGGASGVAVASDGRVFVRQGDVLSVGTPNGAPTVGAVSPVTTPSNQSVYVTLSASDPDGDPLAYMITSAVGGTATVAGNLATFTPTPGATGTGSFSFTASDGSATSAIGTVNVTITPPATMLVNISTRSQVGTGDNVLIAGFVLTGPATTPKNVLIRASGPVLAGQNVGNPLSHPVITLVQGGTVLASNQGWSTAGNAAAIAATGTAVGAFSFPSGSNDSALLIQLLPGVYSALVSGADGNGISLVEVYDGEVANASAHPVNVSTRGLVGTGDNVLIAGFAVSGTAPQKFLIRAVGPGLAGFNVTSRLADPQFHLYKDSTVLMQVTGWTNDTEMQAAVTQTGAFPLPAGSADAAAVVTLEPGNHSVIVSSRSGATGIALVEVYQLP